MPVSSLIVRTNAEETQEVATKLKALKAVTVSEIYKENIVVVTDTRKQDQDKSLWEQIEKIPGVIQCDLIYHNFEDEEGFDD